jgi:hypothetical protein
MEKFLLNYFTEDYSYFVNKRKSEIIKGNSFYDKIKKNFLKNEELYFKKRTYQTNGFNNLFVQSYPIMNSDKNLKIDARALLIAYEKYNERGERFITKEIFNIIKKVWQEYINFLVHLRETNSQIILKNKINKF